MIDDQGHRPDCERGHLSGGEREADIVHGRGDVGTGQLRSVLFFGHRTHQIHGEYFQGSLLALVDTETVWDYQILAEKLSLMKPMPEIL